MELYDPGDSDDGDDEDYGSPEAQEAEGLAYRFVQIIPEVCTKLFWQAVDQGVNHPVVFICDVADPLGNLTARKFATPAIIDRALDETKQPTGKRPGICFWYDLDSLRDREPSMHGAVLHRLEPLVIGYFPVLVVAKGGWNAFPWPIPLKEKSKLHLKVYDH